MLLAASVKFHGLSFKKIGEGAEEASRRIDFLGRLTKVKGGRFISLEKEEEEEEEEEEKRLNSSCR